jgi:hypothetical protein
MLKYEERFDVRDWGWHLRGLLEARDCQGWLSWLMKTPVFLFVVHQEYSDATWLSRWNEVLETKWIPWRPRFLRLLHAITRPTVVFYSFCVNKDLGSSRVRRFKLFQILYNIFEYSANRYGYHGPEAVQSRELLVTCPLRSEWRSPMVEPCETWELTGAIRFYRKTRDISKLVTHKHIEFPPSMRNSHP